MSEQAEKLMEEFIELVKESKGLPSERPGFDHAITLHEGSNLVNIRPYRYPAMQKIVIEELISEMLERGMIHTSSSPFVSPVVLIRKKG